MRRIKPGYFTAAGVLLFVAGGMLKSSIDEAVLGFLWGAGLASLIVGVIERAQAQRGGGPDIGAGQY